MKFDQFFLTMHWWQTYTRWSHHRQHLAFSITELEANRFHVAVGLCISRSQKMLSRQLSLPPFGGFSRSHPPNLLHSNINMPILHTASYTFPNGLARRICLTMKSFFSWWSFPLFLWPKCVIWGVILWGEIWLWSHLGAQRIKWCSIM